MKATTPNGKTSRRAGMSISFKFLLGIFAFGVLATVASTWIIAGTVRNAVMKEFQTAHADTTQLIAMNAAGAMRWQQVDAITESYRAILEDPSQPAFAIVSLDPTGAVITEHGSDQFSAQTLAERANAMREQVAMDAPVYESHANAMVMIAQAGATDDGGTHGYLAFAWSTAEVDAFVADTRLQIVAILVMAFGALLVATVIAMRLLVSQPLNNIADRIKSLSEGDTETQIPYDERRDEIGKIAQSLMTLRDRELERLELAGKSANEEQANRERQARIDSQINSFRTVVGGLIENVSNKMTTMRHTASSMTEVAGQSSAQAQTVIGAAEQASANVQTVASASEEIAASIGEISAQIGRTTDSVARADETARQSAERTKALSEAANKIGSVVSLIQEIAEQTNLLALNATIEAARAGDAGRGFAVVASEVKALATQTAKATEDISSHVQQIQGSTDSAAEGIAKIAGVMEEVRLLSSEISAAIEQQGSATQEISSNVVVAADGTQSVVKNIEAVSASIATTESAAKDVDTTAGEVADTVEQLKAEVEGFLKEVAAA
jgi:methyl-accepting chemotaxis protein